MAERNQEREVYHVSPNASAEKWVVTKENADFRREFNRKEEAEEFAREQARAARPGQLKVHTKDGNMEYESTYGEDPERTPS